MTPSDVAGRGQVKLLAMPALDHRSVPDRVLDLYLYPIGGWGIAFALLFLWEYTEMAMQLLMPLAAWQTGLTIWWGVTTLRRYDRGELGFDEAVAGVRSVGRIVASSGLLPILVFLARDPFALGSLSTIVGVTVVSGVSWLGVHGLVRFNSRLAYTLALAFGCAALPISATGSVTVGVMLGWYRVVVESTPIPDQLTLPAP